MHNHSVIKGKVANMEARILLAADFANVDAAGKLNIIGAFSAIRVRQFPVIHPIMYLVIRLAVELGEFNKPRVLRVGLFDADGREEKWTTGDISFTVPTPEGGHAEFNPIIALQNTQFERPGRYEYKVFVNDDLKGGIPLDIIKVD